jgi:hypothetical protein
MIFVLEQLALREANVQKVGLLPGEQQILESVLLRIELWLIDAACESSSEEPAGT